MNSQEICQEKITCSFRNLEQSFVWDLGFCWNFEGGVLDSGN
jgi:hypothetical protein